MQIHIAVVLEFLSILSTLLVVFLILADDLSTLPSISSINSSWTSAMNGELSYCHANIAIYLRSQSTNVPASFPIEVAISFKLPMLVPKTSNTLSWSKK